MEQVKEVGARSQSICLAKGCWAEYFLQFYFGILFFLIFPNPGQVLVLIMVREGSVHFLGLRFVWW